MKTAARVIHSDPDILGGTPVFVGTRVPFETLLDYQGSWRATRRILRSFSQCST